MASTSFLSSTESASCIGGLSAGFIRVIIYDCFISGEGYTTCSGSFIMTSPVSRYSFSQPSMSSNFISPSSTIERLAVPNASQGIRNETQQNFLRLPPVRQYQILTKTIWYKYTVYRMVHSIRSQLWNPFYSGNNLTSEKINYPTRETNSLSRFHPPLSSIRYIRRHFPDYSVLE